MSKTVGHLPAELLISFPGPSSPIKIGDLGIPILAEKEGDSNFFAIRPDLSHITDIVKEFVTREELPSEEEDPEEPASPVDYPSRGEAWKVKLGTIPGTALHTGNTGNIEWIFMPEVRGISRTKQTTGDLTFISRLVPEPRLKVLRTVEDFREASVGTVVHWKGSIAEKGGPDSWFSTSGVFNQTSKYMAHFGHGRPVVVIWEPEA